jgi:hypothetical protein
MQMHPLMAHLRLIKKEIAHTPSLSLITGPGPKNMDCNFESVESDLPASP